MENDLSEALVERGKAETESIENKYGFSNIFDLTLPNTKLVTLHLSELIKPISETIKSIQPSVFFSQTAHSF